MTRMTLLRRALSVPRLRHGFPFLETLAPLLGARGCSMLCHAMAKAHFDAGDYASARRLYAAVDTGAHRADSVRMLDWIDYKLGQVGGGWPRYPVAHFVPPAAAHFVPGTAPVHVANFNRPAELVDQLGIRAWSPGDDAPGPVLVWFNFHDSLGGEVLAAKVVAAFADQTGADLILAVDERHVSAIRANFPAAEVISKSDDLRPLAGRVAGYFLARDALAHVVRDVADFSRVAGQTFVLPAPAAPRPARDRPLIAVAWKTTNPRQHRFRDLPLPSFADLLSDIDADFVSAQHGTTDAERAFLARRLGDRINLDGIDTSADLAALAAALSACDAVVTIDNSVLHIAGSFGVPTLALLGVPSYWAWPVAGPDSRWYPSVHLIHQKTPGRWADVLAEVRSILRNWHGGNFA